MKLFKLILFCVLILALSASIVLNVIILNKVNTLETPANNYNVTVQTKEPEATESETTEFATEPETSPTETDGNPSVSIRPEEIVIYEDNNVMLTYVGYEEKAYGPVHYFRVFNLSGKALNVQCTEVYIDGCRVYTSGLTCEKILPGTMVVEEFVLLPEDSVDVYNVDTLAFIVKLTNAKSYLDLYESDYIILEF